MRGLILLLALTLFVTDAHARFARSDLAEAVRRAELVLDAQIISSRTAEWKPSDSPIATCGYIYEARVNEELKGRGTSTVTFASPSSLGVGVRYLLFLDSYEGDFPTDVIIQRGQEDEERKAKCLSNLPPLKASWLHLGTFLPYQFVQLSYWLVPRDDVKPAEILIEKVRSRGNVVDLSEPLQAESSAPEAESILLYHELDSLGTTVVSWPLLQSEILAIVGAAQQGVEPDVE